MSEKQTQVYPPLNSSIPTEGWELKAESRKTLDSNVQDVVNAYIKRAETGLKKYGVTTERTDISLLGWLQHLQEELMDAVVYIEKTKKELISLTKIDE